MVQPRPGPGCCAYGPWVPVGGGNLYPSWWVPYGRRGAPRITQIAYFLRTFCRARRMGDRTGAMRTSESTHKGSFREFAFQALGK